MAGEFGSTGLPAARRVEGMGNAGLTVRLRQFFNKPIEMPVQATIIISTAATCGLSCVFSNRGGFVVGQLLEMFGYLFGPLLCVYLFFRMVCDVCFRSSGKHPVAFLLGSVFGFGPFFIWVWHHANLNG